jgi:hypothetical protein
VLVKLTVIFKSGEEGTPLELFLQGVTENAEILADML